MRRVHRLWAKSTVRSFDRPAEEEYDGFCRTCWGRDEKPRVGDDEEDCFSGSTSSSSDAESTTAPDV